MTIGTNNRILLIVLAISLLLIFCGGMTGCGSGDEMTDDDLDYVMNEGLEDSSNADPSKAAAAENMNKDAKNFIGSWSATSEEAKNMYGSLEFTINENGTFDANVTGESFSGTWTKTDDGISYDSELMKGNIYYGDHGKLVLEDVENGGLRVVLNKQD